MPAKIKPLSPQEFCHPGVSAVLMEYEKDERSKNEHSFHLTVMKNTDAVCWLVMIPHEKGTLELKNRYIAEDMECLIIDEKLLRCAEIWAKRSGFEEIMIKACSQSIALYERLNFGFWGEPFKEEGTWYYKMIKNL